MRRRRAHRRRDVSVRSWRPILEGEDAERALAAVDDIVAALAAPTEGTRSCAHEVALLHAYWADARGDERGWERVEQFLDQAARRIAEEHLRPGLIGGFCGVAWVFDHLAGGGAAEDEAASDVDATLETLVGREDWLAEYDLVSGLVGFAVYGLARVRSPRARALVAAVVEHLDALAERDGGGARWLTQAAHVPVWARSEFPAGRYDLGMAHGAAGVIAMLARAAAADVERPRSESLLFDAVSWLLAQEAEGGRSRFASFVAPGRAPTPARAAWCYGDPATAVALLSAANVAKCSTWRMAARRIATAAAERRGADAGVVDAGLCHGAAGLAQLFNRLHQADGDAVTRDAALHWISTCLAMRPNEWVDDASLLGGAAGIGLALLAAATDREPRWDELMLMGVVGGS
jgi:hypothetical protein